MRVALCATKATPHGELIVQSIAKGLLLHDDVPVFVRREADVARAVAECDVAAMVCSANRHQSTAAETARIRTAVDAGMRKLGRRTLIVDTGFVRNDMQWRLENPRRDISQSGAGSYLEVGFDGIKRHADYCVKIGKAPPDRWNDLGVPLRPWRVRRPVRNVLLIGQTANGASSQNVLIDDWYGQAMSQFAADRVRKVTYRVHPRTASHAGRPEEYAKAFVFRYAPGFDVEVSVGGPIEDDLERADAVVCYSSNAAVAAAVEGIPVFCGSDICMAWDVAGHDLTAMDGFRPPDREAWAHRLAFAQWTCDEMASGSMWAHFRPWATKPRKA